MILLHGDPCYGGCDLALGDGERLGVDLIIHLAHTPLKPGGGDKVVFMDAYDEVTPSKTLLEKALELSRGRVMGLVSSIQYTHLLPLLKDYIEDGGGRCLIGQPSHKYMRRGQILGCDVSAAKNIMDKVDGFLVLGGGSFHGLGVALWTGKETWVIDPYRDSPINLSSLAKKTLALIAARIEKAKEAQVWGVIMGLREGQMRWRETSYIINRLERMGRRVVKIALRELSPERLRYYPSIEAFVQTLCPRLSIDDIGGFNTPVLSPDQFKIMVGEMGFEEVYP